MLFAPPPPPAAMIRGNHANCCEFATEKWLGVFMQQLSIPEVTHEVLTVIQCLLADSPEVLNILSPHDIGVIVNLLNTNGRDSKVRWFAGETTRDGRACKWEEETVS